ncbi:uncharacterized protein PITG_19657 [Phytophthora infestans T30-4]|uniref:Transmembrane protein n=1 Tax=Phytophthora infestans (strain T30-4) TaxID=403677 RepID=D0P0I6_PHYIT|nr:uncharacterized protein PITG_19657 [Phytophthora infestans T30-4]EEY52948.1 conserved hypothetical protein [Phytophthora infestans T30-4]|eukprot:XP_002896215.1 conserved hypothetical protein [Phytophthora infestans T30-4]
MFNYRVSTGISRSLVVLITIPLLPLFCVAMIDALPMNSPNLGLAGSGTVWVRGVSVGLADSFTLVWMFCHVPEKWQTVTVLLLPAFKITERNLFCRILRGKDDQKPELVVFTVEISNALFISTSMQQAASTNTSAMLILIDFVQLLVSLCDMNLMLKSINEITAKMGITSNEIISSAFTISTKYSELANATSSIDAAAHSKSEVFRLSTLDKIQANTINLKRVLTSKNQVAPTLAEHNMAVVPDTSMAVECNSVGPTTNDIERIEHISPRERQLLLRKALQILFLTEFLLLNELMEVLTPVMYIILFYGPNREYYPLFDGIDEAAFQKIVRNIVVYGLLEMGSCVLLVVVVHRTTHKFPLQHLAFASTIPQLVILSANGYRYYRSDTSYLKRVTATHLVLATSLVNSVSHLLRG